MTLMKTIEFNVRIRQIMKIIEFPRENIKKRIMEIIEFHARIIKIIEVQVFYMENHENHEKLRIPFENHENHCKS